MHGRAVAIAAIESGVADALLVRALDRATRSQLDAAKLYDRAERNEWRLLDCDKADSGDPSQRLLADIRIAVAAEERRKISERTREGLAKARKDGKRLGRPPKVEHNSPLARRIVRMRVRDQLVRERDCRPANRFGCACTGRRQRTLAPQHGARRVCAGRDCVMAYIRTHDTAQRNRRSGKPVKRYEVVWREQATDAMGLPTGAWRSTAGELPHPQASRSQTGRTQRREAHPNGHSRPGRCVQGGCPHVWRVCGRVARRAADKGGDRRAEAEHL